MTPIGAPPALGEEKNAPKTAKERPNLAQDGPRRPQRRRTTVPKRAQEDPRRSQDAPWPPPLEPPHHRFSIGFPRFLKIHKDTAQDVPRASQDAPKTAPGPPKTGQRCPQDRPRGLRGAPTRPDVATFCLEGGRGELQGAPKPPQKGSKTLGSSTLRNNIIFTPSVVHEPNSTANWDQAHLGLV